MKLINILLFVLIFCSCKDNSEKARKPESKKIDEISFKPITDEIISSAVLYEANIRQYSNEGTFNAFKEDSGIIG